MQLGQQGQRGQPGSSRTAVESLTLSPASLAFLPDCVLKSGSGCFRLGRRTLPKQRARARVPAALALPAVPEASGFCSSPPGSTSSRPQSPEPRLRAPQAGCPNSPLPALPPGLPLAQVTGAQFRVFSTPSKDGLPGPLCYKAWSPHLSKASALHLPGLSYTLPLDLVGNTLTRCAWSCALCTMHFAQAGKLRHPTVSSRVVVIHYLTSSHL